MVVRNMFNQKYYIRVSIKYNIVECANSDIKKDIEKKINGLNITNAEFYVFLLDYGVDDDCYKRIVDGIDKTYLPLYRKKYNIEEYLKWYMNNYNNNKSDIYETKKFEKREKYFDNTDNCLKTVIWEQTNPRYANFNQLLFHAADKQDIERYGYIYVRTLFNNFKKYEPSNDNFVGVNIWDKFETTFESINNTFNYMFDKMKKGIMVGIKDNRLVIFLPFSKHDYENDFYEELYFDDNDKKMLAIYKKNKSKEVADKLKKTTLYYLKKYGLYYNKNIILDRTKWIANDCFFRMELFEGDKEVVTFEDFFIELCNSRKISDCIFFLNIRDHPMLNKDLNDSYSSIVNKKLDEKYVHEKYCPILSVGPSLECADIPLITQDDWKRTSKKIYPDDCKNGYVNDPEHIEWDKKIPIAQFRGSATGCATDNRNVRIKAFELSKKYPEQLNAGIVSFNRKIKKQLGQALNVISPNIEKANFMTLNDKIKYKYILTLDGHVAAFRLGHEFSLKSLLIIPKSKYYLWFSYLLKPGYHYVEVEEDLSDLIEKIKWCQNNDDKCYEIMNNGYAFYEKYLTKEGIFDYMETVLYKISMKSNLSLKKYDLNIGVITIYRDKSDHTRLVQKNYFYYWMNRMLRQLCNYSIIIVEQSSDYLFNIGKLKNIGFDYLKSKGDYDNYIFMDIDSIPDSDLIDYFFKITDSLNALATYGTRYEIMDQKNKTPFVGALTSCSKDVFERINGYGNNFYGWQGEDENLIFRLAAENMPLYVNKYGKIIDTEEVNGVQKKMVEKIDELKNERETHTWEKNFDYMNYKENGLTNLNYNILYENNDHIIVDLLQNESIKKYPQHYNYTNTITKDEYKSLKKNIYNSLSIIKI